VIRRDSVDSHVLADSSAIPSPLGFQPLIFLRLCCGFSLSARGTEKLCLFTPHSFLPKLVRNIYSTMVLKLLLLMVLFVNANSLSMPETLNGFLVPEEDYFKWLKHMGSFKHSLFQKAKNKFKPCLTIEVSKKPRSGAFPTVQKAINSLPVINNCRVVISISAGTYR